MTLVRRALLGAGAALLVAAMVLVHDAARARRDRFAPEEDLLYLPRADVLGALSLGHRELAADLVLMRAVIYFGGQMQQKGEFRWLDNYLDTIVALDPTWKSPYRWAGVATMYNGKAITTDAVLRSNHFLELGVKQFPSDWELAFMLGCNYLFELHTSDPRLRESWTRQGGEWVRHAAIVGGAPPWVPLLAATIMRKEGQEEAAVRHLEEVYLSTQDEKTREEVRNRLLSLRAQVDFNKTERERSAFEAAWKATAPYVSADFFVALGPRRSPRMDRAELARDPVLDASLE